MCCMQWRILLYQTLSFREGGGGGGRRRLLESSNSINPSQHYITRSNHSLTICWEFPKLDNYSKEPNSCGYLSSTQYFTSFPFSWWQLLHRGGKFYYIIKVKSTPRPFNHTWYVKNGGGGGCWQGRTHKHPPGIYIEGGCPILELLLKDNYGGIRIKELTLSIHPNKELLPGIHEELNTTSTVIHTISRTTNMLKFPLNTSAL